MVNISRKYLRWSDAPLWMKICRNVRSGRKWKGGTPEQIAAKAAIDIKRYKRIERGLAQDITFDEADRIADALGFDGDIEMIIYY